MDNFIGGAQGELNTGVQLKASSSINEQSYSYTATEDCYVTVFGLGAERQTFTPENVVISSTGTLLFTKFASFDNEGYTRIKIGIGMAKLTTGQSITLQARLYGSGSEWPVTYAFARKQLIE